MEWRALPLLMLCRTDPSNTVAGSSKEAGPSVSVTGEEATGLVGVAEDEVVTEVAGGVEPGEGRGKLRGSILMPGLFIGGPVGESTSSAWIFSIRPEFLLTLTGDVGPPAGGSCSSPWDLDSCKVRGGRRLTSFSCSFPAGLCGGAAPLNLLASSATERCDGACS